MGNGVQIAAKQGEDKNFCNGSMDDIELVEKGVHSVWSVDDDGDAQDHIEDYSMEAYYAYYDCDNCGGVFDITELGKDEAWQAVKEHFNES